MSQSPETRLFRSYWDDGTLDLLTGASVMAIGLGYVVEWLFVIPVVLPIAMVVWMALRPRLIEPRAGYVEFSRSRRERSTLELAGAAGGGLGLLALAVAMYFKVRGGGTDPLRDAVDALPAVLIGIAALVASALTRAPRFAVYAGGLAIAGMGTVLAHTGPGLPLLVGGAIVSATGAVLLARFLATSRHFRETE